MYRHLLRRDETELTLAGERHDDALRDLSWAFKRPGKPVIRGLGIALRKALRRCTTLVTFDRASFERAVAQVPPNHLFVLAPSHRSYFDFLLSSYLCFQHPELGIPVPQIAAAEEFAHIPVVSGILSRSGAFYVKRGVGKAVPEVRREVERIAAQSAALMFFIEGQRSRGRRVLPPKRGLLRALQATGRPFSVLPLAISYERVPEESAFDRELRGGKRSAMSLEAIVRWLVCLARGQVQLGRIHIACGVPLSMHESTDVQALARNVAAELQRETVVTSFHLRMFLAHGLTEAGATGIDEAFLIDQIERRGGRVLRSETPLPLNPAPSLLQSLQNQWIHWFYADALQLFPEDHVVRDQVARHSWTAVRATTNVDDPRVLAVVRALFRPVIQAYDLVTQHISDAPPARTAIGPLSMAQAHPAAYLPHLEDAFLALSERGILLEVKPGCYSPTDPSSAAWTVLNNNGMRTTAQSAIRVSP